MKKRKVAKAYAKAIFQFARTHELLDEIGEQFGSFIQLWNDHRIMQDFFLCQSVPRPEKEKKLNTIFSEQMHPILLIFFQSIIKRDHGRFMNLIHQDFEHMQNYHLNKHWVKIISPFPLDEHYYHSFQQLLTQMLFSQNIILVPVIDPDILGGFIISGESFRIDCSIKHELELLHKRFYVLSNKGVKN